MGIPFDTENFNNFNLYSNRFDQSALARLRLSFLTSKIIMDFDGTENFKKMVDFRSKFD